MIVTLLCACSQSSADPPSSFDETIVDTPVSALLGAPGEATFDVTFEWVRGAPGGGRGTFLWRQGGGVRRWDAVPDGLDGSAQGWFNVEEFDDGASLRSAVFACEWLGMGSGDAVRVDCFQRPFGSGLEGSFYLLPFEQVVSILPDRTLVGRTAGCVQLRGVDELCLDLDTKVPLFYHDKSTTGGEQLIRATMQHPSPAAPISIAQMLDRVGATNSATLTRAEVGLPARASP
jgi:hypothetical protein